MPNKSRLLYVLEERIPQPLQELVEGYIPEHEFEVRRMTYRTPVEEQKDLMRWAQVVLFAPGRHLSDDVMEAAAGSVKLMQLWSSGYDKFNTAGAASYGIPVANNGGANAISVSEHAMLLMLAVNKWLPNSHARTVEGRWAGNSHGLDMYLMYGKTVGVYGFGNIGRNVAQRCQGFSMRVIYHDLRRAPKEVEQHLNAVYVDRETLLRESDILTLHLHLNADTEGIIDRAALDLMKRNSVLINVSRAQLVDYDALLDALRENKLRGVGLDVYNREPTEPNDPLLSLPNVVATPHMAGSTYDTYAMALTTCMENIRRVLRGQPAQWVVNGAASLESAPLSEASVVNSCD